MGKLLAPSWIGPGLVMVFVVPLLVYGAYSIGDRWYQNYILTRQEESIRAEVMQLREENLRLQKQLNVARSDAGIEQTAREQLGLIKPGDTAFQLVGPQGSAAPAPARPAPAPSAPAPQPTPERPGWLRFLDGIFGH
jgi:cell division protein FtsB